MITKQQAALLWAYGYKIEDALGNNYSIESTNGSHLFLIDDDGVSSIGIGHLGKSHFILARPLSDLTKEIEHEGERFEPLEKLNDLNGTIAAYSHDFPILRLPYWMVENLMQWNFNLGFPEGTTKTI